MKDNKGETNASCPRVQQPSLHNVQRSLFTEVFDAEAPPSCYSRTLLDSAFENEAKCKSETEAAKREVLRLSDKLEQVHKPLKMLHPPIIVLIEYK